MKKLSDIVDNFDNIRVPLSSKQRSVLKKTYPYYGAQNIIDYVDSYLFDGEYLLIAEDGANLVGQNANVCNIATGKFWVNNHAHIIKANDQSLTKYLYYYLNLLDFKPFVTGSAQPKLTKENLESIPVNVHSLKEQKKIVLVLNSLDSKIELNNKVNVELEAMANFIYNYWFVQFDFPDESGKPYKSSGGKMIWNEELKREIPELWDVRELGTILARSGTGLNPRDNFKLGQGNNYYITIKNVKNNKIVFDDACDRVDDEAMKIINKRSNLEPGDVLFTSIEPVGVTYLIHETPTNWNINESVFTIKPNLDYVTSEFLYMLLSSPQMKLFTRNVSYGSIHKGIRHGILKTFKIAYSGKSLINKFTNIINPILKKINIIDKENQELASLRDWLLPMLMNEQVTTEYN